MAHISVDIETFSDVDIRKSGAYKYALSPRFEILLIAFAVEDGPVQCIDLKDKTEEDEFLLEYFIELIERDDTIIHAYNAAFEYWCINQWLRREMLREIPISRYRCTMAHGLYCGYAAGLGVVGDILGLPNDKKKLKVGSTLIAKFCCPQKPTKKIPNEYRVTHVEEPEKWELFKTYCINDVVAEREIERRLSVWTMPKREQALWELDVTCNAYGARVDIELVNGALDINDREVEALKEEATRISGLDNPNSVSQLIGWLNMQMDDNDAKLETLRKADVADLLASDVPNETVARMLEIRQQLGKTSVKKYDAIVNCVCDDGRVRGVMQYYGANRSGRWAGRLIQLQNLPQNHIEPIDLARDLVKARDGEMLKLMYGDSVADSLSQLIRTAFIPSEGSSYVIADFSAIEARVVAWISGEEWVLDTFRKGGDIYCDTASQMFGVPVKKGGANGHLRQKGKIATLACGYGGGTGAMIAMGALRMGIAEEDLPEIVQKWRAANPHIVGMWKKLEQAAMRVIRTGDTQYLDKGITMRYETDSATNQRFMTIELPAGRKLFYANPHLAPAKNFPDRESIHYYGMNQTTKKWSVVDTFGGKLCENVVQALARDVLADVLLELYRNGYKAVFHVHDEVIIEGKTENKDAVLKMLLDIMATTPKWCPGLPLKGAGFTSEYYLKD